MRTVRVKTGYGAINRTVNRLYPLEMAQGDISASMLPTPLSEPSIADCSDAAAATCTASSAVNEGQLVIAAASDPSTTRAVRQEDAVSTQIVPSEQEEEAAEEVRQDFRKPRNAQRRVK